MNPQAPAGRGIDKVAARYLALPHAPPGAAVGLFGGSFNPPHAGHALVAEIAIRRLRLDQLWLMVSPGNPLKDASELLPLGERIRRCEAIMRHPKMRVTAFEAGFDVRYTADALALLSARNPGVRFVWIMGADNLAGFHRWQRWRQIAGQVPIAVIDRPGSTLAYLSSRMAQAFGHARIGEQEAPRLAGMRPPAWTFIHGPRSSLSSTALREEVGLRINP